jgi:ribosomal protein S12 methylthiotransferase
MMAYLNDAGWESVQDAGLADLIIINSCGFIESAKQESINAVLGWRKLYPNKKILLAGCLSQRYINDLPEILTEADGFMGVENPAQITDVALKITNTKKNLKPAKRKNNSDLSTGNRPLLSMPGSAYVKISEGCNNCCSYCAIPIIRGNLVSRPIPDIVEECRTFLKRGIVELNIIGQDIGAYGFDFSANSAQTQTDTDTQNTEKNKESKLPELLNAISALEGKFWVRLLYIHPNHFPLQILDIMERDKRILPYFDIPFQHASQKILTAMNRKTRHHSNAVDEYLLLIKTIRTRLPDAVIRSTFLLGFPGENNDDFSALLDFQQKGKLDWLGCFTYSREEGTASFLMKGRIPQKTANTRKRIIEEQQIPITETNMERFLGQTLDVLVEEQITTSATDDLNPEYDGDLYLGRLFCQAPDIDGASVIINSKKNEHNLHLGTFEKCKIIARRGFDLVVCPIRFANE